MSSGAKLLAIIMGLLVTDNVVANICSTMMAKKNSKDE